MTYPKKLIEVALPLETINREAAREKSIRHGHPSTLHLWWARRPLAAARAVIFAQMVDDPGSHPELFPTEAAQRAERKRLFDIIREFVAWENVNNEPLLEQARAEIRKYAPNGQPPPLLDPFAGGGSIPLEAQRLGLEAHASDLNPVAVLINKALIEIPPKFAGKPPVNPGVRQSQLDFNAGVEALAGQTPHAGVEALAGQTPHAGVEALAGFERGDPAKASTPRQRGDSDIWRGAKGLAEDVRYYGQWMRNEAEKRIGYLYPKADGNTVIAWLWARTVTCPNPACQARMPLVRSFALSTKKGKQAWVEPIIGRTQKPPGIRFEIKTGAGKPQEAPKIGRGARFRCLACGTITEDQYVKAEGMAGRIGEQLMAIVAEGPSGRIYLSPRAEHEETATQAQPTWGPDANLPDNPRWFSPPGFGMRTYRDLFTPRQLVALTTFSDLVGEARVQVEQDARATGLSAEKASAYADAVATYLGLAVSRSANTICSLAVWSQSREQSVNVFSRQALPMNWDFPEVNPFAGAAGDFALTANSISKSLDNTPAFIAARVEQKDATKLSLLPNSFVIATDPPYYDNIGYADLSDFFYVWLRRSIGERLPDLFGTLLVPKVAELVATPYRFGGNSERAQEFFETGLRQAFHCVREGTHHDYPVTVYYAFKQTESDGEDADMDSATTAVSTGWETMLEGLIRAGFQVTGTWPMRTERPTGVKVLVNALASSVVLVCRPKVGQAPLATRREFLNALKRELPAALRHLQQGSIAPVDLAQASIGPGMAIYSRYSRVVESDGSPMRVRAALALINQALDEYLAEQEGEYDADTRWALAWYEQHTFEEGVFGDAETLSRAKNTSVEGMMQAGILHARAGKVRLLRREELNPDWDPASDKRVTVWEVAQHLIRTLDTQGEQAAAALLARVGGLGEVARDLAYRLYTLCERKGWASEALPYNGLVVAWPELVKLAQETRRSGPVQQKIGY